MGRSFCKEKTHIDLPFFIFKLVSRLPLGTGRLFNPMKIHARPLTQLGSHILEPGAVQSK
jgi:hypothetical protein